MPDAIRAIARRHTRELVEIRSESRTATVATVSQRYWQVSGVHKLDALTRILEVEDFDAMLIFVRTKIATAELVQRLEARGFSCAALNGDMNQSARELTIERLKSGRLDILVATDVAARGLHVERISHVVNYDIPYDTEAYVHRIGRTARAGRKGEAILFVAPRERRMLRAIEHATGQSITPMNLPSQADIADKRAARFKEAIGEVIASQDLDVYRALVRGYQDEHGVEALEIAAALACMAQGERPLLAPARPDERGARVAAPASAPVAASVSDAGNATPAPARGSAERDRAPRRVRAGGEDAPRAGCVRYRVEVGSAHGVQPKNIVGALANEAGLDSEHIGPITICDEFSTVDLPDGMPKDLFKHLRQVWVCGRRLKLSVLAQAGDAGAPHDSGAGQHGGRGPAAGAEPRPGKSPGKGHARSKDKGKRKDKSKRKRDRPGPATARGG
jgi:ATP-dependent RNA helicase DeaD